MYSVYKILSIFATISGIFWIISYPAVAHEFWIEPKKYKLDKGDVLSASLFVGQDFFGYENPYVEDNFERFEVLSQGGVRNVNGRIGDRPALNLIPLHTGLNIIVYQSTPTYMTYNNFDKFVKFTKEKGFPELPKQHLSYDFPETGFIESYTRFSKSYVSVLNGKGADKFSGMKFEWVMENTNLNYGVDKEIYFSLYYNGAPHPNSLVTVFSKNNKGKVQKSINKTDERGFFKLIPTVNTSYLIDSVIIRKINPGANPEGAIWESLWASATFKIE